MNKERTRYENVSYEGERSLFRIEDTDVISCTFHDGESPLKEGRNLLVEGSTFQWKYPLWYGEGHLVKNCTFLSTARSGLWYTHNSRFENCDFRAVKYFRRCHDIVIENCEFSDAPETLWTCHNVTLRNCTFKGDYLLKDSENVRMDNVILDGNYLLDGAKNIVIKNCRLNTKDAFWNCQNLLVEDSVIEGEYFGWNSRNVTLRRCRISSHQGFCYIDNLVIEDCYLAGTDLAFEYCSGKAKVLDSIESVTNPTSFRLIAKEIGEIIQNEHQKEGSSFAYTTDLSKGLDDEF